MSRLLLLSDTKGQKAISATENVEESEKGFNISSLVTFKVMLMTVGWSQVIAFFPLPVFHLYNIHEHLNPNNIIPI